jgi:hypothetical protein
MGKYEPLGRFLNSLRNERWQATFSEIEEILQFKLPRSAEQYPAWWSNDETGHSHARAWLDAGWKTQQVDVNRRRVTLVRRAGYRASRRTDPWGCMAGTVRIAPGADLTKPTDERWAVDQGLLRSE